MDFPRDVVKLSRWTCPSLTTWWQCWTIFRNVKIRVKSWKVVLGRLICHRYLDVCEEFRWNVILSPKVFVEKSFSILTRIFLASCRNGTLQVFSGIGVGGWCGEGLFVNVLAINIALGWHWIPVSIILDQICIIVSNVQLCYGEGYLV